MLKQPPPSQYEIEEELNSLFRHGDKTAVAQWLDRDEGQLSRQLRPDGHEDSEFYRAVRFLDGCYRGRYGLGCDVWAFLERINARYQASEARDDFPSKEVFEAFHAATVEHLPEAEQVRLSQRARHALEQFEQGQAKKATAAEEAPGPRKVVNG